MLNESFSFSLGLYSTLFSPSSCYINYSTAERITRADRVAIAGRENIFIRLFCHRRVDNERARNGAKTTCWRGLLLSSRIFRLRKLHQHEFFISAFICWCALFAARVTGRTKASSESFQESDFPRRFHYGVHHPERKYAVNAIFWLPNLLSSMASSDSARNNASSEALARDFHSVIIRLSGGKKVFAFLIASGNGERCQPGVPPGLVNNLSSPKKVHRMRN
jgi:hypothetical protein